MYKCCARLWLWSLMVVLAIGMWQMLPADEPLTESLAGSVAGSLAGSAGEPARQSSAAIAPASSPAEARARAKLLYETIRGALQVMHRDFFDDENPATIPSASLEDVFQELALSYQVEVKWLVVDTDIVNVDHKPADEFEQQAVKALKNGQAEFSTTEDQRYRFVGPIRLASQCLKCHVQQRTSTETRVAGLAISLPLAANTNGTSPN